MQLQDPPLPTTASFHDDLKALLKAVLEGWSEARIEEILRQRCQYQGDPLQEAVPQGILDELAHDRDGKEVQEHRGNQSNNTKQQGLKKNTRVFLTASFVHACLSVSACGFQLWLSVPCGFSVLIGQTIHVLLYVCLF